MGHNDARGFRQWVTVGRHVKKGERGFPILAPLVRKAERKTDDGDSESHTYVYGFRHVMVFGFSQTDGEPLPVDTEVEQFLDSLPVIEVARAWGISVEAFNGEDANCLGKYRADGHIALGVKNLSTWRHELCHAADHRNVGALKNGQHLDQEVVAELGGAILLEALGFEQEADRGGAWEYIQSYCAKANVDPVGVCCQMLSRTCNAVALILTAAEELAKANNETAPAMA